MTVNSVEKYSFLAISQKGWRIKNHIFFQNTTKTAKSVAICKNTEKPKKFPSMPNMLLNSTRCPLEEMGKNSVAP